MSDETQGDVLFVLEHIRQPISAWPPVPQIIQPQEVFGIFSCSFVINFRILGGGGMKRKLIRGKWIWGEKTRIMKRKEAFIPVRFIA
jgi:hypothetical protein